MRILVVLPFLFFIPGYITTAAFFKKGPHAFSLHVLISILITSITGLTLAIFGHFSLWFLTSLLAIYSLVITLIRKPRFALNTFPVPRMNRTTFLLGIILVAGIFLFFQPFEYAVGGWDPGVYVNTGINIAKTGSIYIRDELLKTITPDDQKVFYHIRHGMLQKYPGFVVTDPEEGLITPYFYHLYPIWIAVFYSLFGIKFSFLVNPFFALLSVFAVYLVGKTLFNEKVGLLSAFLLTINIAQMWHARFPTTEILTQFLIFSGIYTLALFTREEGNVFAVISALCFAEALLARITVILLIPPIFILFYCRGFETSRKKDLFFVIPFLLMMIYVLIYDLTVARVPTAFVLKNFLFVIEHRNTFLIIAGFVMLVLVLARLCSSKIVGHLSSFFTSPSFRKSAVGFILLLGIYGYFIRPNVVHSKDAANFVQLGWFLSPVGLLVGMIGILRLTYKDLSRDRLLFYLITLMVSIFFLAQKMVHPTYMWAIRRFVPVVIPAAVILISYAVLDVFPRFGRPGKVVGIGCACFIVGFSLIRGKHIIRHRDYPGVIDFCNELEKSFDKDDILICDGYWLATPLQYIYGKNTLQISDQHRPEAVEKCKRAEKLMLRWLAEQKNIFYITKRERIFSRFLDFSLVEEKKLDSHLLKRTDRFPKRIKQFDPVVRVFKVTEAGEAIQDKPFDYVVDLGYNAFGLVSGFHGARKYQSREGWGTFQWTKEKAELVIPWPGEYKGSVELTLRMDPGRPKSIAKAKVSVFVNEQFLETIDLKDSFNEYTILVLPESVQGISGNRAILRIDCNAWNPRLSGISSDNRNFGVKFDWIRIKTK